VICELELALSLCAHALNVVIYYGNEQHFSLVVTFIAIQFGCRANGLDHDCLEILIISTLTNPVASSNMQHMPAQFTIYLSNVVCIASLKN
jgi:hypothetical protein